MIFSPPLTRREPRWEYEQYYLGEKDEDNRKCGKGELHWSGAQSLESYSGNFIRDTMHGEGDYRWRLQGPQHSCVTYEGHFYCNRLHGYGTMSYPDGRTFSGLFFNNVRWGPGVQSHADIHEDVGLWRADQLVRLAWQPDGPSIAPDFVTTNTGKQIVESNRVMTTTVVETIGMTNKGVELLKQFGADPRVAVEKWSKVYPKYCTDLASPLCHTESFDRDYYSGKMYTLKEVNVIPDGYKTAEIGEDAPENVGTFYAWNNNSIMINMMKHCYKHEKQRYSMGLDVKTILSGPRRQFKPAGDYEIDCWTLLMAAYLGRVEDVAYLVNERNVHPDISDVQGNSAIMYATVGDQPDVIHFLVEAGANVDSYNDNCCTPLGVALMRYVCAEHDVPPSAMLQALLPPPFPQAPPPVESTVKEWKITREQHSDTFDSLLKSPSKSARIMSSKKIKSLISIKDQPGVKRKTENVQPKVLDPIYESVESIAEDNTLYSEINREYCIKITDIFTISNGAKSPASYIFDISDMIKEVDIVVPEDEERKNPDKSMRKMPSSKTFKDTRKTSKEVMWKKSSEKGINSISSVEKIKENKLSKIMTTIIQLLKDGANPKLVQCPQSALLIAVMSNSPDLIRYLVDCGANVNENYHQVYDYTPLDVAVSRPLTQDNLEIVKAILECGGDAQHRLVTQCDLKDPNVDEIQGPTLLHIVLAKKVETEFEEDIRRQLLELLLKYTCSPTAFYKGRSALDIAMSKGNSIFDVFIKNPKTDLNSVINKSNQTMLLKMFSFPYFRSISSKVRVQRLTDLLLFGADPLLKCQNQEQTYQNIFVFTKQYLNEMDSSQTKTASSPATKPSETSKKTEKPKKDEKSMSNKLLGKAADDVEEYKQAVGLVTDCARLLYVRWLQAKLVKELIATVDKYKHRHWNMILKSCEFTRSIGLWLSPQRSLEIWDILSETKSNIYNDQRIITHIISIVVFLSWQDFGRHASNAPEDTKLTIQLKDIIDADVKEILRQHKADKKEKSAIQWKMTYVKPELSKHASKFNVCFECIHPLRKDNNNLICSWCKQITFCSYKCMKSNVHRPNCHPCSGYLKMKYFSSSDENFEEV